MPVSFPGEKTIKKGTIEALLSKRSYVDSSLNVLVLLQGGKTPSSAAHAPKKYSKILHILSYRYEVYKHAIVAIQVAKSNSDTKLAMQKLTRVLQYLDDVRTAYVVRARRGGTAEVTWFSPELEYHLWLDYTERAYHDAARASIEERLGVTFEYVLERRMPDIMTYIQWDAYIPAHNMRFDMCGLAVTLGKAEPPAPQASRELAKAILDDLKTAEKKNRDKGKQPVVGITDEEKVKGKRKSTSRPSATQDKVETSIRARTERRKPTMDRQPLVDGSEHEKASEDDSEMVAQNGRKGEQSEASDNEDAIIWQAIDAEGKQDVRTSLSALFQPHIYFILPPQRRSSEQKHFRTMQHNTSLGKHGVTSGDNTWNEPFRKLRTFIHNRVLNICNIDINKIHDEEGLQAWQTSVDPTNPCAFEILGYIHFLRSALKLEQDSGHFQNTICTIGKANRLAETRLQEDLRRANADKECQIGDGRMEVVMEDRTHMDLPDEMVTDQEVQPFLAMTADTRMTQGLDVGSIEEVSKDGGGDEDDGTTTPTDAMLKRKRAPSKASPLSQSAASKKTKHPGSVQNPLAGITMETLFDFSDDGIGSSSGAGL
ncbi:hypothetical protein HD554DRAFT_2179395 [Boletus coccyginus]|nr:hypothetical protein HD554DRAFT_2179395 [Boletus coccyginus]